MKWFLPMFCCIIAFRGSDAFARPLSTEEWRVAGQGEASFEAGHDITGGMADGESRVTVFTLVYGLSGNAELAADFPWMEHSTGSGETVSGPGDVILHMKYALFEGRGLRPGIAVKSTVKFATGKREDGLGTGDEDVGFSLISSLSAGRFNVRFVGGYMFAGNRYDPSRENFMRYGGGLAFETGAGFTLLAEVCGESCDGHSPARWERHGLRHLAGVTYEAYRGVTFDAAGYVDISGGEIESRGVTAGITMMFDAGGIVE